jgi:GNAT superfamily N-acetyltransferase
MIEIRPVRTKSEKLRFISFPWKLYKDDPLWVMPLLSERQKATDPARGIFFENGYADFFLAFKDGRLAGTICCSHENTGDPAECSLGFFECIDDYAVAEALFQQAEAWARQHNLGMMCGTYNLDREEGRGILLEGRDRPPVLLCGHNPPYYSGFFERYGFGKRHDDGLAYALDLDQDNPKIQRLFNLAARVKERKGFTIRAVNMEDIDAEIDRILVLQNRALEHLPGFVPYSREAIAAMLLPLKDLADPQLVLFAEANGQSVGWFPAIPNFNEILIHLNGLRYPWDTLRALRYKNLKPGCLSIKSVAVLPEYWDSGVAVMLFAEMTRLAIAKGYRWLDLSLTGEDNPDTWDLAHHMGAKIYKRYRFYKKELT